MSDVQVRQQFEEMREEIEHVKECLNPRWALYGGRTEVFR